MLVYRSINVLVVRSIVRYSNTHGPAYLTATKPKSTINGPAAVYGFQRDLQLFRVRICFALRMPRRHHFQLFQLPLTTTSSSSSQLVISLVALH